MKQNQNHKRVISGDKRCPASVFIALRRDMLLEMQKIGPVARSGHPAHSSPDPVEIVNARLPA